MLSGLDYLARNNRCHRHVKPANILYHRKREQNVFQLADFGLASHFLATTHCGTDLYKTPELYCNKMSDKPAQTPKMDVWSLLVTINSLVPRQNPAYRASAAQILVSRLQWQGINYTATQN